MIKWLKYWWPTILFNLGELVVTVIMGLWLGIELNHIALIILAFVGVRLSIGLPKHYKRWQICLVWTTAAFLSLFVVANVGLIPSLIMAVVFAFAVSGHADYVKDMFMWKNRGEPSKYQKMIDYVSAQYSGANPPNNELLEFEKNLKEHKDKRRYAVFHHIFVNREKLTHVAELLDVDACVIARICDAIMLDYTIDHVIY